MLRIDAGLGKAADTTLLTAYCIAVYLKPKEGRDSLRVRGCGHSSSAVLPVWQEALPLAEKATLLLVVNSGFLAWALGPHILKTGQE